MTALSAVTEHAFDRWTAARHAADTLGSHDVVVVMGSGWGVASAALGRSTREVAFGDIPGFLPPTVAGHAGVARTVEIAGKRVLVLQGRVHLYEGHGVDRVVHAVRAAILAGCGTVVLTNACGGLRPEDGHAPGVPVLLSDQLNLTGITPMGGPPPPEDLPGRFVDLTDLYSPRLRAVARAVDPSLGEGVYAGLLGGAYETPAEIRMLRGWGADLVGMSTVLESIAARHLGAEILGIGLVTNLAAGISPTALAHEEVTAAGAEAGPRLGALLRDIITAF